MTYPETLPPSNRAVGTPDPPADNNLLVTAVSHIDSRLHTLEIAGAGAISRSVGNSAGVSGAAATSGATSTVNVSTGITHNGTTDVSASLQAVIDGAADGATILFPAGFAYGQGVTLNLIDRNNITIDGNGSSIKAVTTGTDHRQNIKVRGGTNIVIKNLKLIGANPAGTYTPALEFQYNICLESPIGVTIDNCWFQDGYSDFIELQFDERGTELTKAPSTNVWIKNCHGVNSSRQGIGLLHFDGCLIENCYFSGTQFQCFDVEPVTTAGITKNLLIRNNVIAGISGSALSCYVASDAQNFEYSDNRAIGAPVSGGAVGGVAGGVDIGSTCLSMKNLRILRNFFTTYDDCIHLVNTKDCLIVNNSAQCLNGGYHAYSGGAIVGVRANTCDRLYIVNNAFPTSAGGTTGLTTCTNVTTDRNTA